ncbi:MAG: hypothetical protein GY757_18860 [bacterium]|nr:hypothetical protein [bacterium]
MGLTEVFRKAAVAAHNACGDLNDSSTYHSTGTFGYTASTGAVAESGGVDYTGVDVIFIGYQTEEIDGEKILRDDRKALIAALNLTPTPKVTDYITDSNSKVWNVVDVGGDPAPAEWKLQCRAA